MSKAKPARADAVRNRQRVLEVAQHVFAREGLAVPIDEIARRAGLGVGTVYRHFPTKEALFEAVVLSRLEQTVADARALAGASDAGAAFFDFLERLVEDGAAKKDLIAAIASTGSEFKRTLGAKKKELGAAMGELLARAQRAGAVRADATVPDVIALVRGPFAAVEPRDGAARARLFAIVCDGLRARGASVERGVRGHRS
jgi:AcrR family transcriptional regulator